MNRVRMVFVMAVTLAVTAIYYGASAHTVNCITQNSVDHADHGDPGGNATQDTLTGGPANNAFAGLLLTDILTGGNGNDKLCGNEGDDNIDGEGDADNINGGDHQDDISGGANGDNIHGGALGDDVKGNDGNDTLGGDGGADEIRGQAGADDLIDGRGSDDLWGGALNDAFTLCQGDGESDPIHDFNASEGDGGPYILGPDGGDRYTEYCS